MLTTAPSEKWPACVEIERLFGEKWRIVDNYDITKLDPKNRSVQVRETDHYAPKDKVEQYAIQMGYTVFPPIIIRSDDYLVDGNTRVAARLKRKDIHTTAIVVDVPYKAAKATVRDDYMALAASLNMTNGQSLTSKELRMAALPLVRANWKADNIARRLGITSTRITNIRHEIDAIDRMTAVGVEHEGMDISKVAALGKKNALVLNNAPYVELARLAQDAGLNVGEIDSLAGTSKNIRLWYDDRRSWSRHGQIVRTI